MVLPLAHATADTCGGKAAPLAVLLREGLPVPDGFVVPLTAHRDAVECTADGSPRVSPELREELARRLAAMGDPVVAVRSSAVREDTAAASAAGQYESVIAVRGPSAVSDAVRTCWASARSRRVADYWRQVDGRATAAAPDARGRAYGFPTPGGDRVVVAADSGTPDVTDVAVLVQRLVDADVAGVMFTPSAPGGATRVEASWGLGLHVVGGVVAPDVYEVLPDGKVRRTVGDKASRVDRTPGTGAPDGGLSVRAVPVRERAQPVLDDATAGALAALGGRVASILGRPQDVEWALAGGRLWILQARPITVPLPPLRPVRPPVDGAVLTGVPGASGSVSGVARVLHGPDELTRVVRGDIVVCRDTEPAWTPVFGVAGGVVTETGGVLSHAAIVAREHGIPAVLGVPRATADIRDGARVTLDGTAGTVSLASEGASLRETRDRDA
ncbi:pyruvate, phosphate dikinase [Myceligenerans salitolerans]|uniref:Pyruvate, phosphate dikinase n=2 Tax=Myceligenerans salitolerans TaxID=1230528 RepID=A0ABS3I3W2_9MICO|nr:pyruvate, phosphate dikinase [Myceligenerans salitolerans]